MFFYDSYINDLIFKSTFDKYDLMIQFANTFPVDAHLFYLYFHTTIIAFFLPNIKISIIIKIPIGGIYEEML